jgi:hypothetical protein
MNGWRAAAFPRAAPVDTDALEAALREGAGAAEGTAEVLGVMEVRRACSCAPRMAAML